MQNNQSAMKVAMRNGKEIRIEHKEIPAPGYGQILLDIEACGICGTDTHPAPRDEGTWQGFGHEVVGRVSAVGEGVNRIKPGQRVALDSATPCGACDNCRNARQELCLNVKSIFSTGTLGFAEKMLAPEISAIPCDDMQPAIATLQEPLGVALDLVRVSDVTPGSNVLIMGQGPIGLMALALARRAGARKVFVSDFSDRSGRKKVAEFFGADAYIDPRECPLADYAFNCEIDRVLVTAPPALLPTAFDIACKGAIVGFIGIAWGDGAFCRFNANDFHFKKLQLRASFASPALYGSLALQLLRENAIEGEALVSHGFSLDNIEQALQTACNDPAAVKVVITNP